MHGKDAIVEEVLDWRPFDYFTVSTLLPIPGAPKIMMTHAFQDRIKWRNAYRNAGRQAQAEGQSLRRSGRSEIQRKHHQGDWKLATDAGRQQTSISVMNEPPLIASSERFLTEPVKSN
jgi:hypothetical protein